MCTVCVIAQLCTYDSCTYNKAKTDNHKSVQTGVNVSHKAIQTAEPQCRRVSNLWSVPVKTQAGSDMKCIVGVSVAKVETSAVLQQQLNHVVLGAAYSEL